MKKPDFEHETEEQIEIWRLAYSYYILNYNRGVGTLCRSMTGLWLAAVGACLVAMLAFGERLTAEERATMAGLTLILVALLGTFWWIYRRIDQRATDFAWEAVNDGACDERDIHNLYSAVYK